ncbi:uncharacterized protein LOC112090730 [Morus notabilis]|uniref:uncharacterized protein LOC112090730 n=1 Tax=Morus notabilis TaxID=981085 RepID=UPI000CECF65B|nr:uncharacterized protein LOC112090730 [Morus notabilis]
MKHDIVDYVSRCLTCQEVKAEHKHPAGELQPLDVPEWKWEHITMDFVVGLPKTSECYDAIWVIVDRLTKSAHFVPIKVTYQASIGMPPYEALYERKCRSPIQWYETREKQLHKTKFIQEAVESIQKIHQKMKTAHDRQKSYADKRRRPLEFSEEDSVFLKIVPMKGVMRFGKKGKLSPRYIGPFQIIKRIEKVAYQPPELDVVHNVFHVSMLKKYILDPSYIIEHEPIQIHEGMTYEEQPVQILAREEKRLRNRSIPLVKILLRNQKWKNQHGNVKMRCE